MIITDPKENEIIINLLRVIAYDCNLYWNDENDIDIAIDEMNRKLLNN